MEFLKQMLSSDAKISSNFPPGLCDSNVFLSIVFKGSNSETTDTPEYFSIASLLL